MSPMILGQLILWAQYQPFYWGASQDDMKDKRFFAQRKKLRNKQLIFQNIANNWCYASSCNIFSITMYIFVLNNGRDWYLSKSKHQSIVFSVRQMQTTVIGPLLLAQQCKSWRLLSPKIASFNKYVHTHWFYQ